MLFTRLPITVADATLPVLDSSDITTLGPQDYETEAYDHWIFNNGSLSLKGLKGGAALTPMTLAPSYTGNAISLALSLGGGLKSPLIDRTTHSFAVVFKNNINYAVSAVLAGALANAADANTGSGLVVTTAATGYTQRYSIMNARSTPTVAAMGAQVPMTEANEEWLFMAGSLDASVSGSMTRNFYAGGPAESSVTKTESVAYNVSTQAIALGNGYSNISGTSGLRIEIAEFILYDKTLSLTDLKALYQRSVSRMAKRGITVR